MSACLFRRISRRARIVICAHSRSNSLSSRISFENLLGSVSFTIFREKDPACSIARFDLLPSTIPFSFVLITELTNKTSISSIPHIYKSPLFPLFIQARHPLVSVPSPLRLILHNNLSNIPQIPFTQLDFVRLEILFQIFRRFRLEEKIPPQIISTSEEIEMKRGSRGRTPGIGRMLGPCARSQARESWPAVQPFFEASFSNSCNHACEVSAPDQI